jgi:hypothetical protein
LKKAILEGIKAFLDVKEEDSLATSKVAKEVSLLTVGRMIYNWADWAIAAGLASFSFWMQANSFSETDVYLGTFLYDFFAAAAFFFLSDMTGCDFTLGQSFRRVAGSFARNGFWGKFSAGMLFLVVSVKAIIWEGPEVICVLFQKELKKRENIWIALFILSAIQGVFGTWLYTTGYNLWQKFVPAKLGSHYILLGIVTFVIFIAIVAILKKIVQWSIRAIRFFCQISQKEKWLIIIFLLVLVFDILVFFFVQK